ncbi:MAG: hypothetical protein FD147_2543 [Chloroflexi bacterium]|nr:MAG: hypothetical protein FD147_2543 [Chloroflexota bacterium]
MNDDISLILADCLEALEQSELTLDQCLARYPEHRRELELLLKAALELCAAPESPSTPTSPETARARLLRHLPPRPSVTFSPLSRSIWQNLIFSFRQRRPAMMTLIMIISLFVSLVAGGGAVYASGDALPGEVLYPVKVAVEGARLAASFSDAGDAALLLEFAGERLDEARALLQEGRMDGFDQALNDFAAELAVALNALQGLNDPLEAQALVAVFTEALLQHEAALSEISAQIPAEAQPAFDQALVVSEQARAVVDSFSGTGADGGGQGQGGTVVAPTVLSTAFPTSAQPTQAQPTVFPTSAQPTQVQPTAFPTSAQPTQAQPTVFPTSAPPH